MYILFLCAVLCVVKGVGIDIRLCGEFITKILTIGIERQGSINGFITPDIDKTSTSSGGKY